MLSPKTVTPRSVVGIDLQETEIRLLHLAQADDQFIVINACSASLPPDVIVDGKIKRTDIVLRVLQELVHKTQTQGLLTVFAMPMQSVLTKRITLLRSLSRDEREVEIQMNLNRYLQDVSEKMCFDFVVLQQIDQDQDEVLLLATREEQMNTYQKVIDQAGLQVRVVDIDCYTIARAMLWKRVYFHHEAVVLLFVENAQVLFLVYQAGQILFQQTWARINSTFLAAQIKRALALCQTQHPHCQIKEWVIAGDVSLREAPWCDLAANYHEVNPFQFVTGKQPIESARYLRTLGLTLRGMLHVED